MNLLVIGNGFDIAHGLRTSYSDFLNICLVDDKIHVLSKTERNISELIHSKDILLKNKVRNNPWVKFFLKRRTEIGKNWVDFEREIKRVCEIVSSREDNNEFFKTNEHFLKDDRGIYFFAGKNGNIDIDCMKSKLKELIDMLNFYLLQLEDLPIECQYQSIIDFGPTHVINFNYTSTFLKQYRSNISIDFVHGKTGVDTNSIVLGFDSLKTQEKDVEFAEFLKYFQMVNNDIELNIHLGSKIHEINTIIFGHSLDKTDEDIIKDIIDNSSKITLIYHSDGHKIQMIKNLIDIYGKIKFNELCLSRDKKIHFKKQGNPIDCNLFIKETNELFLKIIGGGAN
ncbi:MAG: bacteriophage abortive infection AbiH family protein, partial [Anaeroplasmataceae bacterium]|nr:bacteriophage abortive infection AbiH family protein [Anaeroplasmataceae bacterium]